MLDQFTVPLDNTIPKDQYSAFEAIVPGRPILLSEKIMPYPAPQVFPLNATNETVGRLLDAQMPDNKGLFQAIQATIPTWDYSKVISPNE